MVVLDLVLIGLAVTLEPIPVTVFILILSAERGVIKGLVFVLTWLASLVVIVAAVELATGGNPPRTQSAPSTAGLAVKLAVGILLVLVGVRRHRRRGRPRKPPTWMKRLDHLSLWTVAGLSFFVQPWPLVAAGAATVVEAGLSGAWDYLTLVLFCLLCSASILTMELYATLAPDAARRRLDALRTWIDNHRDQVIVTLSLLIGLWLMGKSLSQLVT
ncbi:MAG TPA: GAP family protein [Acidimicrobiales bacterium]|nr:GAP family protein [Acidimicrobiales bacterium]